MNILITGASGQLGRELNRDAQARGMRVFATDLPELDITDSRAIERCLQQHSPDVVFNAAAWTAVDDAENNEQAAFAINATGAGNLAEACGTRSIPLVHYSTDYVFDGTKSGAYTEADTPDPINIYGKSKLAAESAIRNQCQQHLILRTSWIYSASGNNFVKIMLRLAQDRSSLRIVQDQVGKPTSAQELARLSLDAIGKQDIGWGIYHLSQPEPVSWYEFAMEIFAAARQSGIELQVDEVTPVGSEEFPTAARRPANSVLDCSKFESAFELRIPDWHDALESMIGELQRAGFFA